MPELKSNTLCPVKRCICCKQVHLQKNEYAMLKKLLLCAAFVSTLAAADAQTLQTPQPSPTQTIKQNFGIGTIELSYSRPSMKGRKIFGALVPFGNVWRTGANDATTLT